MLFPLQLLCISSEVLPLEGFIGARLVFGFSSCVPQNHPPVYTCVTLMLRGTHSSGQVPLKEVSASCPQAATSSQLLQEVVQWLEVCSAAPGSPGEMGGLATLAPSVWPCCSARRGGWVGYPGSTLSGAKTGWKPNKNMHLQETEEMTSPAELAEMRGRKKQVSLSHAGVGCEGFPPAA